MNMPKHLIDHGVFCVWAYNGPSKKARGFWHGHNVAPDVERWAYALRSQDGTYWETSRAKGGFSDEHAACEAAHAALAVRSEQDAIFKAHART